MFRGRRGAIAMASACMAAWLMCGYVRAEDEESHPPAKNSRINREFNDLIHETQNLGPWEKQSQFNSEATDLFFQRQGWTSEPDQFARNVLRDVDRIPPWQYQQRMDAFLNPVQSRYNLTESQKSTLSRQLQIESMKLTFSHFQDVTPIAMEVIKTRAANKPFTPEQVARWSRALRPILDEGMKSIDNIEQSMAPTMTPEQRKLFRTDMDALRKRQETMEHLMERWSHGDWDPTQWGLDNDPVHAAMVAELRAKQPQHSDVPKAAVAPTNPEDESSWERYVREFCAVNQFDAVQTKSARAVLAEETARAKDFRRAHQPRIASIEAAMARETEASRRRDLATELKTEMAPIGELFKDMCGRLEQLMTASQKSRMEPSRATQKPQTAVQKIPTH